MSAWERCVKRLIDLCVSAIGLILLSPLFLICYITVKREDGGPAIFKQQRIGRHGLPFYIYKFRSMRMDAEKDRKSTRLNSSHANISYAVFCLKKKKNTNI